MWHAISKSNTEALMNILDENEMSAFRRSFIVSSTAPLKAHTFPGFYFPSMGKAEQSKAQQSKSQQNRAQQSRVVTAEQGSAEQQNRA